MTKSYSYASTALSAMAYLAKKFILQFSQNYRKSTFSDSKKGREADILS